MRVPITRFVVFVAWFVPCVLTSLVNSQEDSFVYKDAEEMQKVLEEVFTRETAGTDMPGADPHPGNTSPLSGADEDEPAPRVHGQKPAPRRTSLSDEEYLSSNDDD